MNNLDQVIWLAENWKWAWHLNLFSMTRVKEKQEYVDMLFTQQKAFLSMDSPIILIEPDKIAF